MKLSSLLPPALVKHIGVLLTVLFLPLSSALAHLPPILINAGGPKYTDTAGDLWVADTPFVKPSNTFKTSASISGTSDPALYQSERWGATLLYGIPVENGQYDVVVHFAEIYLNKAGARIIDVFAEGILKINDLDIWSLVGKNAAYSATFPVTVSDGVLSLQFVGVVQNAKVSAIELHELEGSANLAPVVNAGADKSITLPTSTVSLTATATDDGIPNPPAALTYAWTKVNGPGTVTFNSPSALSTSVSFTQTGVYVLRLTVSDSALSSSDDVVVTFNAVSSGPTVTSFTLINANTEQPIAAFNPLLPGATLNLSTLGTTNLNVRANTNPVTVGSVVFGLDGNPNFRTENVAPYALAGDNGGNYNPWTPSLGSHTLTGKAFTGSNGTGTSGAVLTVSFSVVNSPLGNQAPVVNAGPDKQITPPTNSISLTATASDDNLPQSPWKAQLPVALT